MRFIKCAASLEISSFARSHQDVSFTKNRKTHEMDKSSTIVTLYFQEINFYYSDFIGVFIV